MTGYLTTTVTSRAQVPLVHAGDGPALIANNDITNTIWISSDFGVQPNAGNAAPLPPQASLTVDGTTDVFAVTQAGQTATVVVIPGGLNFFQLVDVIIKALVINSGGVTSSGVFTYNGIGAPGNPPIAVLVGPGVTVDPYGNNLVNNGTTAAIVTSQSNVTAVTITTATTVQRLSGNFPIPANRPNAGTVFRINFGGLGVMGSTAVTFSFIVNVSGNNFLQLTFASSTLNAGNAFQFSGYFDVFFTSNGVSGNADVVGLLSIWDTTTGNTATVVPLDQSNTLNTTVANSMEIDFQWGSASAGRSITNLYSSLEILAV